MPDDHSRTRTHALLLAGGLGTRLRPLTDSVPKCLVPVGGRMLLDYWIDKLDAAGVGRARINTHYLPDRVRAKIAEVNRRGGVELEESYEPELLGSAGTITANRDFAEGAADLLIIYADTLSSIDLDRFLAFHRDRGAPFTMLLFHAPNPAACGIAELDDDGLIVGFVEKPENPTSDLANAGVYAVTTESFRNIADRGGFDLGYDILPHFIGRMAGYVLDGYHRDIGTLESLRQANDDIASGRFRRTGAASLPPA